MPERCYYFVEGPCEAQLIDALKQSPTRLIPGRVKVFNIIQKVIPKSLLLTIHPGSIIALMFDTDVPNAATLAKNIELIDRYCKKPRIIFLPQVLNLEDELARCTDVNSATDLTHSRSTSNFKTDFCKLKASECRHMLERHHIVPGLLWSADVPSEFSFIDRNSSIVKAN